MCLAIWSRVENLTSGFASSLLSSTVCRHNNIASSFFFAQLSLSLQYVLDLFLIYDYSAQLPRTPKRLFEKLTELVVTSILRPRVATGNQARRFVRQADLNALLRARHWTCDSPKELAKGEYILVSNHCECFICLFCSHYSNCFFLPRYSANSKMIYSVEPWHPPNPDLIRPLFAYSPEKR
jgi:hypothetical protein